MAQKHGTVPIGTIAQYACFMTINSHLTLRGLANGLWGYDETEIHVLNTSTDDK